jgi:hypothetical protein
VITVTEYGVQALINDDALVTHFIIFSSWQLSDHSFQYIQPTTGK